MFTEQPRPRLLRFLWVDPPTLLACLILPTAWLVVGFVGRLGYIPLGAGRLIFTPAEARWLLWGSVGATVVLLPMAVVRIRSFLLATANPVVCWGNISRVDSHWWGRRVQFFYFSQGDKLHGQVWSVRHRWVMDLAVADEVVIVFNQYWPERAVIRGLYSGADDKP